FEMRRFVIFLILVFIALCDARKLKLRHLAKPDDGGRKAGGCRDPPDLKEQLAEWLSEAAEGNNEDDWIQPSENDDDWTLPVSGDSLCDAPLDTSTTSNVMQRSLCPWTWRVSFDDAREPKMLSEASCMCRRSRGTSGSYCMPIKRDTPILKRIRCNPETGYFEYARSKVPTTVGCHSVLPRTQRATYMSSSKKNHDGVVV
ncbi:hypothetical protein PENTCL1PPCAC_610, partial [Pristionchus entomophagus]